MFLAGDEFCNTQFGNNNPYCQDNEISWLDWSLLEKNRDIFEFFRYMISFRKNHAAIRGECMASGIGFPAVSVHTNEPWNSAVTGGSRFIGVMFAGSEPENPGIPGVVQETDQEDLVYLAVNVYWEDQTFYLPKLPNGYHWRMSVNTALEKPEECCKKRIYDMPVIESEFVMRPRSVAVFIGV